MPVELSIGRKQVQDIQVQDKLADDQHAVLELRPNGTVWIKDLQSRYGTLVNNHKVTYQQLLPGDILQIGFTRIAWESYIQYLPKAPEIAQVNTVAPPEATLPEQVETPIAPKVAQTPPLSVQAGPANIPGPAPVPSQGMHLFFNLYTLLLFVLLSMALGGWLLGLLTK